jgi:hypothetical protein
VDYLQILHRDCCMNNSLMNCTWDLVRPSLNSFTYLSNVSVSDWESAVSPRFLIKAFCAAATASVLRRAFLATRLLWRGMEMVTFRGRCNRGGVGNTIARSSLPRALEKDVGLVCTTPSSRSLRETPHDVFTKMASSGLTEMWGSSRVKECPSAVGTV